MLSSCIYFTITDMHHHHNHALVVLSVVIAIFASYTSLDLVNSLSTSKGRIKWIWLFGGSLAMGVGIWSMHFIGMLAFRLEEVPIYYDLPLLLLSVLVAIMVSALALYVISNGRPNIMTYGLGSFVMGSAIAGMHYIGIASMRMAAIIQWNFYLVSLSILTAFLASYAALWIAFRVKEDHSVRGLMLRGVGGALMGCAIAGMHYIAMAAMSFTKDKNILIDNQQLLATDGLAAAVIIGTLIILGVALTGSNIDRALSKKTLVNEALLEGIRARDEFLSIASHELKTPLTAAKLQLQIIERSLMRDNIDKDSFRNIVYKADKNIGRLDRLVNDMLDVSRIKSGKLGLNKETANLVEVVNDIVDRFQPQYEYAGAPPLNFHTHIQEAVGYYDVLRIEQVISNLLSNALKYGQKKEVEVTLEKDKDHAFIKVKDNGMGIPHDVQEKIFHRFERAVNPNEISGLGLGLYIVREIVEAHGGTISVESIVGSGSLFKVQLPLIS